MNTPSMNALELAEKLENLTPSEGWDELRRLFVELDGATRINKRIFADNQRLHALVEKLEKDKANLVEALENIFADIDSEHGTGYQWSVARESMEKAKQ